MRDEVWEAGKASGLTVDELFRRGLAVSDLPPPSAAELIAVGAVRRELVSAGVLPGRNPGPGKGRSGPEIPQTALSPSLRRSFTLKKSTHAAWKASGLTGEVVMRRGLAVTDVPPPDPVEEVVARGVLRDLAAAGMLKDG